MTFRARASALLLVPALALGACGSGGGDDKEVPAASADATTTVPPSTVPPTTVPQAPSPLTGESIDATAAARPVVMVKVDNSQPGRAVQAGIDQADVLYEEKVEGTVTRFVALFQANDAELVGPIRSVRTTDASIISAFPGGVFVYAGGAGKAVAAIKSAPVTKVTEMNGSAPFTYPPGKHRPYALFARVARLRQEAGKKAAAPPALAPFAGPGEEISGSGATPASKASVVFGSMTTATLTWDATSGTWLRSTNGSPQTVGGKQLAFKTVVIQSVPYRNVGYLDAAKNKVDEAVLTGSGNAIILAGGKQVKARWTKSSAGAMTTYTDASGTPIRFPQGNVLIMLPPTGAGITVN